MHAFGLILQQSDVLKWVSVLVKEQVTKGFLLLSYRMPKYGSNIALCDLEAILGLNCDTCIVVRVLVLNFSCSPATVGIEDFIVIDAMVLQWLHAKLCK